MKRKEFLNNINEDRKIYNILYPLCKQEICPSCKTELRSSVATYVSSLNIAQ